jgi:hypothetical protein
MLVVVFVLGIGLIGALSFFNINLNNQFEAKNELIAAGLAQEGADLVRNIKDYNQLNPPNAWDLNLSACNGNAIDFNSLSSHTCSSNVSVCMNSNGQYCQCSASCNTSTNFTRTIGVSSVNLDNSRTVTCTVTWNGRTTKSEDILYNNNY